MTPRAATARLPLVALVCLGPALAAPPTGAQLPMPVSFEAVMALPRRAPDLEVRYGDAPSQRVHLWRPAGGATTPAPVVVLVHGGCWRAEYSADHIEPLASALTAEGFAVWTPEYRRLGELGGGWPGTFEDVARALDLLQERADPALDLGRVVLAGHSAGGHLALWAAARSAFEPTHPMHRPSALVPRGVVALAAVSDLEAYGALGAGCPSVVAQLLGGTPATQPERYRWASPVGLPHPVPVVLIHGTRDTVVSPSQARALPWAEVRLVENAEHFDVIHPGTAAFPVLVEELRRLTY